MPPIENFSVEQKHAVSTSNNLFAEAYGLVETTGEMLTLPCAAIKQEFQKDPVKTTIGVGAAFTIGAAAGFACAEALPLVTGVAIAASVTALIADTAMHRKDHVPSPNN